MRNIIQMAKEVGAHVHQAERNDCYDYVEFTPDQLAKFAELVDEDMDTVVDHNIKLQEEQRDMIIFHENLRSAVGILSLKIAQLEDYKNTEIGKALKDLQDVFSKYDSKIRAKLYIEKLLEKDREKRLGE